MLFCFIVVVVHLIARAVVDVAHVIVVAGDVVVGAVVVVVLWCANF